MLKANTMQIIRDSVAGLKRPVKLILFTSDVNCDQCNAVSELADAIKTASGKIAFEHYDMVMDRDKTAEYGIQRVPSLVVQGPGVRAVTFSGAVEGVSLMLLLDAAATLANGGEWFPEGISATLNLLTRPVTIRVILENDCTLCRPVAETAVGLALTNRLVQTEIIVADDYPELLAKHKVKVLPYTLFGQKLHLEGHVSESTFLEMIFQAAGKSAEAERKCMVCGTPSDEIICTGCKTRIQAEAVDHKRHDEKLVEKGSVVERTPPHQH